MKKILIIIVSLIVLIVIGVGIYCWFFYQKHTWNIKTDTTVNTMIPTYADQRINIDKQNEKNSEIYNTAIQEQNILLCGGISDSMKQVECHDMIVAHTAKKSGTIETCDTLTSTGVITLCRDVISTDRAIATSDRTLCSQVIDMERRSSCEVSIDEVQLGTKTRDNTITREFCNTLGEHYQSLCITQIHEIDETSLYRQAIATNDLKLCEKIITAELRSTCQDTIRLKSAVNTDNTTLCESIADTDKKLYCQAQVSKTADITLYKTAISGTDTTPCQKILNTNLRNKCSDTIIITAVKKYKNTALCDGLTATGMISACRQISQ
jgi:hypothetical protein